MAAAMAEATPRRRQALPRLQMLLPLCLPGAGNADAAVSERPSPTISTLEPPKRIFVSSSDEYENMAWAPGDESCWSGVPGLSFGRCCKTNISGGNPSCWIRGRKAGLSFASCCSGESLQPSPLPRQRRVVAMLSTTPYRVFELESVLLSLAHQTHKLDAIYLAIPYIFHRDWTWYNVPWWYLNTVPHLRLLRCEQDYRAETGLLCALRHEPDPDTYILIVDDDIVYHPKLVESLLRKSAQHPGAMIGSMAYGSGGVWCRTLNEQGVCVEPNLAHSTYGILFQRRFFDAGIFNFAAAAHAYTRQRPDLAEPFDYIVTSCMIQDNLWFEAHLARKGVPRVFLKDHFGARPVGDLAFGRGSLFSGYKETYHFHGDDPHTIDAAEKLCMRAVAALWGPTLWAVKPRRVAAVALPAGARIQRLEELLGGIFWFTHEAVAVFACSRRSFSNWRRLIAKVKSRLDSQVNYLHEYAPGEQGARRAPFFSEPFDLEAITPEPLAAELMPDNNWGFRPSAAPAGRPLAGAVLPPVDLVELCPPAPAEEAPPPPPSPGQCPPAGAVRNACGRPGRGERVVEEMPPGGYASVRCCHDPPHDQVCFPNWRWRNLTWWKTFQYGSCFPISATYLDAHRACESVALRLCDFREVMDCCGRGCEINDVAWLHSPAAAACLLEAARAAAPLGAAARASPSGPAAGGPAAARAELRGRQEKFFEYSEEARSTVIDWVTPRDGM